MSPALATPTNRARSKINRNWPSPKTLNQPNTTLSPEAEPMTTQSNWRKMLATPEKSRTGRMSPQAIFSIIVIIYKMGSGNTQRAPSYLTSRNILLR